MTFPKAALLIFALLPFSGSLLHLGGARIHHLGGLVIPGRLDVVRRCHLLRVLVENGAALSQAKLMVVVWSTLRLLLSILKVSLAVLLRLIDERRCSRGDSQVVMRLQLA